MCGNVAYVNLINKNKDVKEATQSCLHNIWPLERRKTPSHNQNFSILAFWRNQDHTTPSEQIKLAAHDIINF